MLRFQQYIWFFCLKNTKSNFSYDIKIANLHFNNLIYDNHIDEIN